MLHDTLFVFDIETVIDDTVAPLITNCDSANVAERRAAIRDYHLNATEGRNDFPRQPFHKIVAISFLEAEIFRTGRPGTAGYEESYSLREVRSGGREDASEEELVRGFFSYFQGKMPRLVSFNGRNFDLPVLKFRAMKYGIASPALHQSGDKWNSYTARYSSDWHCDLLDVLKDHGAMSGGLKLHEVAAILGLPGKFGPDGSKVEDMFDAGDIAGIRNYCETDVLNTYLVYLHHMHHTGVLRTDGLLQAVEDVKTLLQNAGAPGREGGADGAVAKPHFAAFYETWQQACGGRFTPFDGGGEG